MSGNLTVISTFAGCGGSSLGYQWAGFHELLAIDFNEHAIKTFQLNFPEVDAWQADIRKVTADMILERTGIKKGELDVLDGSPPCQGFSTAGKRKVIDERNDLPWEFIRLIKDLQPRAFVMENVSGMAKGGMRGLFNEILAGMKEIGYHVEVRKLNAMWYSVPQSRERIIFIGMRDGQKIKWPMPMKIITVKQALDGCPHEPTPEFNDKYAQLWSRVPCGGNASFIMGTGFNSCVKVHPDRPAPTLPKTQTGRGFATIAHWRERRALSVAEAKRLMSFPDSFEIEGSYSLRWERIGNAVPPKMMQAIAECVKEVLDA
jgi:DNA (cytosine-5)-methyltransferase 1